MRFNPGRFYAVQQRAASTSLAIDRGGAITPGKIPGAGKRGTWFSYSLRFTRLSKGESAVDHSRAVTPGPTAVPRGGATGLVQNRCFRRIRKDYCSFGCRHEFLPSTKNHHS